MRAGGVTQTPAGLTLAVVGDDGGGLGYHLVGLTWEQVAEQQTRARLDVLLVEMLPNYNEAMRFTGASSTRWRFGGARGEPYVNEAERIVGMPLKYPMHDTTVARALAMRALELAKTKIGEASTESPPAVKHSGVAAIVTLTARPVPAQLGGFTPLPPDETLACAVDQPLVIEGPFLRVYDGRVVRYLPLHRVTGIRVPR